jgi:prolyl-tRNA editing enzyme YbaK/EbsC (Cys-tRNA(Pro) deacylase)
MADDTAGESASVARVRAAAVDLGLAADVVEFAESARTAAQAASAVGCDVDQIAKSMIFEADGQLVLALTSGSNSVDPDKLAALASATTCERARPNDVRTATGFAIGGVSPLGHLQPIRCWIDPHLLDFTTVWIAAGTPHHVLEVPSDRLIEATNGSIADFVA